MRSRLFKYLLVLAAAVALIAAVALLLLRVFFPPEQLRRLAESRLSSLTGRDCQVGSAGFSLLPAPAIEFNDLSIAEEPGYANPHFCSIKTLSFALKWLPLLSGRIEIDRLTLKRPEVYLVTDRAGLLNTSTMFPADTSGVWADTAKAIAEGTEPAFSLRFNSIAVADGVVHYIQEKEAQRLTVTQADLQAWLKSDPGDSLLSLEVDVGIGGIESEPEGFLAALCREQRLGLSCRGTWNPDTRQMNFEAVRAEFAGLEIEGEGRFRQAEDYPYRAGLKISLGLDRLPAPEGLSLEGRIQAELALEGSLADPEKFSAAGTLTGREVSLASESLPGRVKIPELRVDFKGRDLELQESALTAGSSEVIIAGALHDFPALLGFGKDPKPRGGFWQARVTGPRLALADFMPEESRQAGPEAPPESPSTDRQDYPPGRGRIELDRLVVSDKLTLERVKLSFSLKNNLLAIGPLTAGLYSGNLAATGQVRFPRTGPLRSVFDVEISRAEVGKMLKPYSSFGSYMHGKISTKAHLEGSGSDTRQIIRTLTARGGYSVAEGRIQEWPTLEKVAAFTKIEELDPMVFQDWYGELRIQDGRFYTDNVVIGTPQGLWNLEGSYGFDGSLDYSIRLTLNRELSRKYKAKLPSNVAYFLKDNQERLSLAFKVSGNADKPGIKWDTRPLVKKAVKKIERKLSGQLDKLVNKLFGRKSSSTTQAPDSAAAEDSSAGP